jgi:glutamate synthase domain-containing protein 2
LEEIEKKAKTGEPELRGLTGEDMASIFDELALHPSAVEDLMGSKEGLVVDTEVMIGEGRDVKFPLLLSRPLFVDSTTMAKVNKSVRIALAYGASITKTPVNVGEGMLPEEEKIAKRFQGNFIIQWSPFRIGVDTATLGKAKAIVIDLSSPRQTMNFNIDKRLDRMQGKGGLVGAEILGPVHHLDMDMAGDLKNHVDVLREVTGYSIPIAVKVKADQSQENTKLAVQAEPDAVILDSSFNPFSTLSVMGGNLGTELLGSIPPAVKVFKAKKARKKGIKLLVSGGFRNGADIVKALAMGADAVGIVESAVIALGCNLCGECPLGRCEAGIVTRDSELKSKFNWKSAGKGLANYLKATNMEIETIMESLGVRDFKELDSEHVTALTYDAAAITGIKLAGYDRELPMWFH